MIIRLLPHEVAQKPNVMLSVFPVLCHLPTLDNALLIACWHEAGLRASHFVLAISAHSYLLRSFHPVCVPISRCYNLCVLQVLRETAPS